MCKKKKPKSVKLMNKEHLPKIQSKLRACIGCGLLLDEKKWETENCPNCQFDIDDYHVWTSANFAGMLAIFSPEKSWCSQWMKYIRNNAGLYCLDNYGKVTHEIISHLDFIKRPRPEWVEREISKNSN